MNTTLIHITSGQGPAECERAVALALRELLAEAKTIGVQCEVLERRDGQQNGCLASTTLSLQGKNLSAFKAGWLGTLLWISPSPYRRMHQRKNWFIGIYELPYQHLAPLQEKDIFFQTMRASGPGGQHVNKTETAVRAVHGPSGISVTCREYRSQLQNKHEAIRRLKEKHVRWQELALVAQDFGNPRDQHQNVKRGNPVRTYKGEKFLKT
jgi:peptide chain release factor